jgi:site-specific DNA-methyltransferase (adenine-specific)
MPGNLLYYGDNLDILRDSIKDESIDLIYLDPPFNSDRNYNILFSSPCGRQSEAQITAFEDSWHWGPQAETEFTEILNSNRTNVAEMIYGLRKFLGENDIMAYLTMMANRLIELHRVLKNTGSIYLHCDPAASHYLKIILDGIFSAENFRNEIIWRRSGAHSSARRYGPIHDTILFYSKSDFYKWNKVFRPYSKKYVESYFNKVDENGDRFRSQTLTGSGVRYGDSGKPWRNYDPTSKGRHWAFPGDLARELNIEDFSLHEKLDYLADNDLLAATEWLPEYRQYLRDSKGVLLQDLWHYQPYTNDFLYGSNESIDHDVKWIGDRSDPERLGYPTQKPLGLLERIINSSTDIGDIVLDPFCGCGTTVHAAQKLNRQWIGIDITNLAISLIERRIKEAFPQASFEVHGTPKDEEGAKDLAARDKYQFQWWACSLVNAQPYQDKKKGADGGIDGIIYFQDDPNPRNVKKIIVSVKGGENVNVSMVRDLSHVVVREEAQIGLFVTLASPTRPMIREAVKEGFYTSPQGKDFPKIQILTVSGLLNGIEKPTFPDYSKGSATFKKAKREKNGATMLLLK